MRKLIDKSNKSIFGGLFRMLLTYARQSKIGRKLASEAKRLNLFEMLYGKNTLSNGLVLISGRSNINSVMYVPDFSHLETASRVFKYEFISFEDQEGNKHGRDWIKRNVPGVRDDHIQGRLLI